MQTATIMISIVCTDTLSLEYNFPRNAGLGLSASVSGEGFCWASSIRAYFLTRYLRTSMDTASMMIRPLMMYCKYALMPKKYRL